MSTATEKPNPVTPCECPLAGWCARHQRFKGATTHQLCQQNPDYRALWDGKMPARPRHPERNPQKPRPKSRGFGDTVAKTIQTATFGLIKPCKGCKRRQRRLNRLVPYSTKSAESQQPPGGTDVVPKFDQKIVKINSNAHGFGDASIMAWVSEGSKNAPVKLVHWATGAKRQYLELFGQEIASDRKRAIKTFQAYSQELRLAGNPPRILHRGKFLGITAEPKRPQHTLTERELDWGREQIGQSPTILLYPNTAHGSREWPPFYWIELAERIQAMGARALISGGAMDARYAHLPHLYVDWRHTAALMLAAVCVVGNDSGPAHTAGTLDVPMMALLGPSHPSMFLHLPSVECLSVSREEFACANCYFHAPFSKRSCGPGCLALAHLKPHVVAARLQSILESRL